MEISTSALQALRLVICVAMSYGLSFQELIVSMCPSGYNTLPPDFCKSLCVSLLLSWLQGPIPLEFFSEQLIVSRVYFTSIHLSYGLFPFAVQLVSSLNMLFTSFIPANTLSSFSHPIQYFHQ